MASAPFPAVLAYKSFRIQVCDTRSVQWELQQLKNQHHRTTAELQGLLLRAKTDLAQGQSDLSARIGSLTHGDCSVDGEAAAAWAPRSAVGATTSHGMLDWVQIKALMDFGKMICNISVCGLR